jgi:hypothetical protein
MMDELAKASAGVRVVVVEDEPLIQMEVVEELEELASTLKPLAATP